MAKKKNTKSLEFEAIRKILEENDTRVVFEKTNLIHESQDLYDKLRSRSIAGGRLVGTTDRSSGASGLLASTSYTI